MKKNLFITAIIFGLLIAMLAEIFNKVLLEPFDEKNPENDDIESPDTAQE